MQYEELLHFLQNIGRDPSRLIFEDELTGIYNRRFLLHYFQYKIFWDNLAGQPVSLVMMDMDRFKEINDTYGHQVGDEALVFLAGLLKKAGGDEGLPIRYAGDEFMILLPRSGRDQALQLGEDLLNRVHQESMPVGPGGEGRLRITLSIGIASAPEDAQTGRGLIQKADTALYYAKKNGRDRLANAGAIPPHEVFQKAALYQLQGENIAGRKDQLAEISQFLQSFSQGQSHFILVEGGSGLGKSTFLEVIQENLSRRKDLRVCKVGGAIQEMFRPYYLATRFLVDLLNEKEGKGLEALKTLDAGEIAYLSSILPHLDVPEEARPKEEDESAARAGLFNTLVQFVPRVAEGQPLVLLIDDLQFADEASLLLLRHLLLRAQVPLFICCAVIDPLPLLLEGHRVPLDGFYKAFHQELSITRVKLVPLTALQIGEHLQKVFPGLKTPENFERDLEQATQGSPLFLGEVLCKLVLEQKITLSGQQWSIEPLPPGSLPESLEAVIRQKIQGLDPESRRLLYQASAFGEDVPLSVLTGSANTPESKVLEFVDRAVSQGLMNFDFQLNDPNVHFRGKRILEIMEEEVQPEEERQIHGRAGDYQEALFHQFLVPSAAPLIYHYRRAANLEKSRTYEQFERIHTLKLFNPAEAFHYAGERRKELPPPGEPLDPESLALVPGLVRGILTALRNIQLYPAASDSVVRANRQVKEGLDAILQKNDPLAFFQVRRALMINGQKADLAEFRHVGEELLRLFGRMDIQGIIFHRGLAQQEVSLWLDTFGRSKPRVLDKDHWEKFCGEHHLEHIELKQIRYTLRVDAEGDGGAIRIFQPAAGNPAKDSQGPPGPQKLGAEEVARVPEILRALLNSAKYMKLYPLGNRNVASSFEQLHELLRPILARRRALVLAQVRSCLVVNGAKLDTQGIEAQVDGFLKFLDSYLLVSLTFLENLPLQELKAFVGSLGQGPPSALESDFWQRTGKALGLKHILFDQVFYEARVTPTQGFEDLGQVVEIVEVEGREGVESTEPIPEEQLPAFLQGMSSQLMSQLAEGRERPVQKMLKHLYADFPNLTAASKENLVESCRRMLEGLTPALQNYFAKLLAGPLLGVFPDEKEPKILREIASLLHRLSAVLIQFLQYPLASRILLTLQARQKELEAASDPSSQRLAKVLERKLDPVAQALLAADLGSEELFRRHNATLLLGALGRAAVPLLIEAVRKNGDLRVRTVAANLLAKTGEEAGRLLRREAVLGGAAEERARILDVLDLVTRDVEPELAQVLGEESPRVRQAALHLLERLNDRQGTEVLLDYARGGNADLAREAIECLGRLKSPSAVGCLVSIMENQRKADLLAACCRALGQIGDPAAMEPLIRIVTQPGLFQRLRSGWGEVRGAAALALGEMPHPRAREVLLSLENDAEPRVREAARRLRLSSPAPDKKPPRKDRGIGKEGTRKTPSPPPSAAVPVEKEKV